MGIYGYYAKWNKKSLLENKISALKKIIKQEGEKRCFLSFTQARVSRSGRKVKRNQKGVILWRAK